LLALPGIGPYTARAVLAFAFEQHHGVVETNVARVLARAVKAKRLTASEAQATADGLVPEGQAWSWNQAIVDLGATVCVTGAPRCGDCPLAAPGLCAWFGTGRQGPDPALRSAGTSGRQSRFAGSDRQGRGRLVDAMRKGPLALERLAETAGWPDDPRRAARVAAGLVADGLAVRQPGRLALPRSVPSPVETSVTPSAPAWRRG
jgi:A/G-specific adenine glycosylase